MKHSLKTRSFLAFVFSLFVLTACQEPIERSGVIIDKDTKEPLEGVSVDIYMKYQRHDSLKESVLTDKNGRFVIKEKRDVDESFQLFKKGYIGHVNSLRKANDTFLLEKIWD